jgi:hypothetical protein
MNTGRMTRYPSIQTVSYVLANESRKWKKKSKNAHQILEKIQEQDMIRIAINGLGRIGRAVLKQAIEHRELEVAAVNDLVPVENLTYLIKYDTVYGRYERDVRFEQDKLVIAGIDIPVLSEKDPAKLPWADLKRLLFIACQSVSQYLSGNP